MPEFESRIPEEETGESKEEPTSQELVD